MTYEEVKKEVQDALDSLVRSGDIVLSDDGRYRLSPRNMHTIAMEVPPLRVTMPATECSSLERLNTIVLEQE